MPITPEEKKELIKAANKFAALAREYNGDRSTQIRLLKQADKLQFITATPFDTIFKQWETVRTTYLFSDAINKF